MAIRIYFTVKYSYLDASGTVVPAVVKIDGKLRFVAAGPQHELEICGSFPDNGFIGEHWIEMSMVDWFFDGLPEVFSDIRWSNITRCTIKEVVTGSAHLQMIEAGEYRDQDKASALVMFHAAVTQGQLHHSCSILVDGETIKHTLDLYDAILSHQTEGLLKTSYGKCDPDFMRTTNPSREPK